MKSKTIASLLTMTLLFAFVSVNLPMAKADITTVTWLTHWESPKETEYWEDVINYYETYVNTSVDIVFDWVTFPDLYNEIGLRNIAGNDPDIIHMHAMWVPAFANWKAGIGIPERDERGILAVPPADVQDDINLTYSPAAVAGVTWKGIIWGYPTEYNTWALVYNKVLIQNRINELSGDDQTFLTNVLNTIEAREPYEPITWDDLKRAAKLLTKWNEDGSIAQTGFVPFIEGMPEEQRFQFMSLLWSNAGGYIDLSIPDVSFDDNASGYEVMDLYYDLGFGEEPTYDPLSLPDYWWTAWVYAETTQNITMMVLPTWMQYIREAMVDDFYDMGVSVLPTGPSLEPGDFPTSLAYGWVMTVTQHAVDDAGGVRADAAWRFLNWLDTPRAAESIPMRASFGPVPRGAGCTILGDYLIADSIIPSRMSDQSTGKVLLGYEEGDGEPGDQILTDFWFKGFIDIANDYGRPDKPFIESEEVQTEMGIMFETVTLTGGAPVATVDAAVEAIQPILPVAGDVNLDGAVGLADVPLLSTDIDAEPPRYDNHAPPKANEPPWIRGRSDFNNDDVVDVRDIVILSMGFL